MPPSKGRALEIAKRRKDVAALYLQGRYQWEIAAAVGLDRGTISRDLKAIREDWKAQAVADWTEKKNAELDRIDLLERVYWAEFERSGGDPTGKGPAAAPRRRRRRQAEAEAPAGANVGNLGALAGVQWCIERRCRLLGLDAPQRMTLGAAEIDHEIDTLFSRLGLASPDATAAPHAGGNGRDGSGGA